MNKEQFKKLKVGDKVCIAKKKQGFVWNSDGKMDKWLGKVMTIRELGMNCVLMEEDKKEYYGNGWNWFPEMIECVVSEYPTITEHLVRGNKVIVKLSNGKVGVARCNPEDVFDICEGTRLALERAYGYVREVKRRAEVGEYIKIVDKLMSWERYNNGDIFKVIGNDFSGGVFVKGMDIVILEREYVVLENYKPKNKK